MKKTIEVEVCDRCQETQMPSFSDHICIVCGKNVCYNCWHKLAFGFVCRDHINFMEFRAIRDRMRKTIKSYRDKSDKDLQKKIDRYVERKKEKFLERMKEDSV